MSVRDFAIIESRWAGLLKSILTRRVRLDEIGVDALAGDELKVFVEVGGNV